MSLTTIFASHMLLLLCESCTVRLHHIHLYSIRFFIFIFFYFHFGDKHDLVARIFFYSHFNVDVMSIESAAESMNQVRKDFIFYKRAFEDSSQNALWRYMVDCFTERYEAEA